jgi:membrane protein DedA with SNARE-associated domain
MNPLTRTTQRTATFWAAATLGVPIWLSVALLLILVFEMSLSAADIHHLTARVIAIAIIEALIIGGTVWGLRQSSDRKVGAAVAAAIVGVVVLVGWVLTL